jgi:Protein of unknown function (DUF3667)
VANELETAAAAASGGFFRRKAANHPAEVGATCANCGASLQGPWCHACGQSAEDFHRSIIKLAGEVVEGLLHVDGRLWRTLPDLLFRPGRLTRAYLEGHRAPQIPPLRLFLVVLLGVFVVGGLVGDGKLGHVTSTTVTTNDAGKVISAGVGTSKSFDQLTPEEREKLTNKVQVNLGSDKPDQAATMWLRDRLKRTLADPERFRLILEQWSERFAFLMLPISALMLSVLFVFQRRFYLFDHTIFSLHSLSAVGLVLIVCFALKPLIGDNAFLPMLGAPVHLFVHMRGVYRTSVIGTLARMFLLAVGTFVWALLLVLGLVAVGLNGMGS